MTAAVDYLIHSSKEYDCYFLVGPNKERVGVIKELLVKCSEVLRNMLQDSALREKGDVEMPDVHPDAVKMLLKFAYDGLNGDIVRKELSGCDPQTVLHVVALADKYLISELKEMALSQVVATDNVEDLFLALHCLRVYNAASLEPIVRKIVEEKTEEVFGHPEFLNIDLQSLVYILMQDMLNVPEVEVWKATLAWAKNQGNTWDTVILRELLTKPLKLIRFYTFTAEEFWTQVEHTNLLSKEEIYNYKAAAMTRAFTPSDIFHSGTEKRLAARWDIPHHNETCFNQTSSSYNLRLYKNLKLKTIVCYGQDFALQPYTTTVSVTISEVQKSEFITTSSFTQTLEVEIGENIVIPMRTLGLEAPELTAGVQYRLSVVFKEIHTAKCSHMPATICCHQFVLGSISCRLSVEEDITCKFSHIKQIIFTY